MREAGQRPHGRRVSGRDLHGDPHERPHPLLRLRCPQQRIPKNISGDAIDSLARAAEILLEMKRLEHLKAIAGSQKRVNFVDPSGTFPGTVATTDLIKKSGLSNSDLE